MSLEDTFSESMKGFNIKPTQKIAIGVSGGSDSLALVLLANSWAKMPIVAITVDHKLRKESEYEAQQVSRWLEKYNIQHHILNWEGDKPDSNIQSNARDARYKLMTEFCKANKIKNLLIAHNKEDQAETLLIRLMRGSGLEGLCGMSDEVIINQTRTLRPLLDTKKEDLRSYLRSLRQGWVEDPSNENDKFTRVQVRNFIKSSPEPDLLVSRLVNTCSNLQKSNNYISEKISQEMAKIVDIKPEGYCILDIKEFKSLHEESAVKILSKLIKYTGGDYYKPRYEKICNLYEKITSGEYNATLGGCEIFQSKKQSEENKLLIVKELSATASPINIFSESSIVWDGRFDCSLKRVEENIYSVCAIGENGLSTITKDSKELKKLKVPKKVIFTLPALKTLENIVAAPHIGYYADKKYENLFKAEFRI